MEWLSQNWLWILVIAGVIFFLLPRFRGGGAMGGCCGGGHADHGKQAQPPGSSSPSAGKGCH